MYRRPLGVFDISLKTKLGGDTNLICCAWERFVISTHAKSVRAQCKLHGGSELNSQQTRTLLEYCWKGP